MWGGALNRLTQVAATTVALGALIAACGGEDNGEETAKPAKPVSGSFIGQVRESPEVTLVAIVVAPAKGGATKQEVRAYVCDGVRTVEWFPGSLSGNEGKLKSDDGDAHLRVSLHAGAASGTVTLPDGTSTRFKAEPATGPEGLYSVSLLSDGRLRGTSEDGNRLEGQAPKGAPTQGRYRVPYTVTADGKETELVASVSGEPGNFRLLLWRGPDGQILQRGGKTTGPSTGFAIRGTD